MANFVKVQPQGTEREDYSYIRFAEATAHKSEKQWTRICHVSAFAVEMVSPLNSDKFYLRRY